MHKTKPQHALFGVDTMGLQRAHRVAAGIDTGMVWLNCWLVRDLRTPFGGTRQSGVGREGSHYGIDEFLEVKYLCMGGV